MNAVCCEAHTPASSSVGKLRQPNVFRKSVLSLFFEGAAAADAAA